MQRTSLLLLLLVLSAGWSLAACNLDSMPRRPGADRRDPADGILRLLIDGGPQPDQGVPATADTGVPAVDTGSSPPSADSFAALRVLCVDTINSYRQQAGVPPLARYAAKEACADKQARDDSAANQPHMTYRACGEAGQNQGMGSGAAGGEWVVTATLKGMYNEGPGGGHHDAMVNAQFTKVTCGFARTSKGGYWMVNDFYR